MYAEFLQREAERAAMRDRLRSDPSYLPAKKDVIGAFSFGAMYNRSSKYNDPDGWELFCDQDPKNQIFEYPTREFITSLGEYFSPRIAALGRKTDKPVTILEVGSGSGRLAYFLDNALRERAGGLYNLNATNKPDDVFRTSPLFPEEMPVENLDYADAVGKYNPQIVICSWMPSRIDWTPAFRVNPSVQEYLLIGPKDGYACGALKTWGDPRINPFIDEDIDYEAYVPEYTRDGFERVDLEEMTPLQLSLYSRPSNDYEYSTTVSFRRVGE